MATNEPFFWGSGGEILTDEEIRQRRKVADALAAKGTDFSPVGHWTQGLARVANALAGAVERGRLDRAEKESREYDQSIAADMIAAFGAGGGSSAAAPSFAGDGSSRTMTLPDDASDGGETFAQIGPRLQADLVKDFQLPSEAAAGVVGSLAHESGGFGNLQEDKPVVPGSRGGFGYAQWTGPRRTAFEQWASANNLDPRSYEANYGFLKHELQNTPEGNVLASLSGLKDANAAAQVFTTKFLRPGIPAMDSRLKWTQRALGFANSADVPAPGASPASLPGEPNAQGFVIPGQPAVAETEEDVQRLEQNMPVAQAATNPGDVLSPVPMAQPQRFQAPAATVREAVERATQTAAAPEAANLPATAPVPPVRAADLPAPNAQPAMAQVTAPVPVPQAGPSQEAINRVISDPNLSPSMVMALNGPNREAALANLLQSNPETAEAARDPIATVARALTGATANDNRADLPAAGASPASYPDAAVQPTISENGASPGVSRVSDALTARGINPAIVRGMTDPRASESTRRIASILFQQQMSGQKVTHVDLGNSIGVMDARGNIISRISKEAAPSKPELREVNGRLYEYSNGQVRDVTPADAPPAFRTLTDPAERARFGIPENDNRPYQLGSDGRLHAPPAGTTVQVGGAEKEEEKERGKGLAQRFNKMAEDGPEAAKDLAAAQRLDTLLNTIDPGLKTAALEAIRLRTGLPLDPNASNVQAAGALIDYLVPRMRVAGSGSSSDRDMRSFKGSLASLMGTPEGNAIVMQTIGGMAQMRVEMARIAEEYQVGDIDAREANRRIRELPDPFGQYRAWQAAQDKGGKNASTTGQPTPRTQAEFDALPSGALYTDPDDGKTYRKP